MLIKIIGYAFMLMVLLLTGCGGSDSDPVITTDPNDTFILAHTYTGQNITIQLNDCQNSANNGDFVFDDVLWSEISFDGTNFEASLELTAMVNNVELQTTMLAMGTIDQLGDLSGTFTGEFTVNGVIDTTGNGSFDGTVSGQNLTLNFSGQDTAGDTCTTSGTIVIVESSANDGGSNSGELGAIDVAGDDAP